MEMPRIRMEMRPISMEMRRIGMEMPFISMEMKRGWGRPTPGTLGRPRVSFDLPGKTFVPRGRRMIA